MYMLFEIIMIWCWSLLLIEFKLFISKVLIWFLRKKSLGIYFNNYHSSYYTVTHIIWYDIIKPVGSIESMLIIVNNGSKIERLLIKDKYDIQMFVQLFSFYKSKFGRTCRHSTFSKVVWTTTQLFLKRVQVGLIFSAGP